MRTRGFAIGLIAAIAICAIFPNPSAAQFGGLGRDLYRNLTYAGNQNLISYPQNGPFFNSNQFNQRIEFNRLGQGYAYENWRFFGSDTYNNPDNINLGPIRVQLGRDPNLLNNNELVGLHTRVGYTTTLLPEIFFQQQTAQRFQNVFSNTSTATPAPLRYNISVNTGVQDTTISGNVLIDSSGHLNALGFYDLNVHVLNEGTYDTDGVLVVDHQDTDFEVGPINVSGNVVTDLLAGATQLLAGVNGPATPFRIASSAAQKDRSLDEILGDIADGEDISEEDRQALIRQTLTTAFVNDPLGMLTNGTPSTNLGRDDITLTFEPADPASIPVGQVVPEPAALSLLLAVCGLIRGRRLLHGRRARA